MTQPSTAGALRLTSAAAGILYLLQAVVIVAIGATDAGTTMLPVTVDLPSGQPGSTDSTARIELVGVDTRGGAIALLLLSAVVRIAASTPPLVARYSRSAMENRHTVRWVEYAFTAPISVFLVAQLNGITDIGALVALYAITSAVSLFAIVQERSSGSGLLAVYFGCAVGIVPWGIVAFHQVGAGIVGDAATTLVRVITLVMLAAAAVVIAIHWKEQSRSKSGRTLRGEREHIVVCLVASSALAWSLTGF